MKHKTTMGSVLGREAWGKVHRRADDIQRDRKIAEAKAKKEMRRKAAARRRPAVSANLRKHQERI